MPINTSKLTDIAAVGAYAVDRYLETNLFPDTNEAIKASETIFNEKQAEETTKAQAKVDEAELQSYLGKKELVEPSNSNENNVIKRIEQRLEADKALEAAKKAQTNLEKSQKLKMALMDKYKTNVNKLQKQGIIGKIKANNQAWESFDLSKKK